MVVRPEDSPQACPSSGQSSQASLPSEFTLEEEAVLKVWAKSVNSPARAARPAKVPSLDAPPSEAAATASADPDAVIKTAAAQVGKRYSAGGDTPRQGFDCSGLTSYAYSQSGMDLPRNSREQYRQGTPVPREELKKGDLVFFGKKGVNHVGIYVADGNFVPCRVLQGGCEDELAGRTDLEQALRRGQAGFLKTAPRPGNPGPAFLDLPKGRGWRMIYGCSVTMSSS